MEISFTRLRLYLECPWKYKLFFVDGRRIPLTPASALGVALHRALERHHRKGPGDLEGLLAALDDEWLASAYREADERQWLERGRRILRAYHKTDEGRRTEVVGVEREFVYPLGRHSVRGMIDRLDRLPAGRVEVIDYKTQLAVAADAPPADVADSLQLRFYALGAREALGYDVASVAVWLLAAGRQESAPYDAAREEELKALIVRTADAIEAGRWPPETSFCPRCDFRRDCQFSRA